jgi:hypothetical protein
MGFGVDTVDKEELSHKGGATLTETGWYHVTIEQVKDGLGPNDKPINGFTTEVNILAGKPDNAKVESSEFLNKKLNLTFWAPDMSKSEGAQTMTRRINTAFLLAVDLMTPEQLGKPLEVDPMAAVGRHFVVHLEKQQKQDGNGNYVDGKYLRIAYSDIFHIDDPQVSHVPKNVASLKYIKPEHRHKAEYFAYKAKNGASGVAATTAPVPAGGVDVDV